MYSYIYDPETGGLLLLDVPNLFSKEPRPVYSYEMDILGFNVFWQYSNQENNPYMWAESNIYWYRGKRVATISGGNLYEKPQIILEKNPDDTYVLPINSHLSSVDLNAMVKKNIGLLEIIEKRTKKRVYRYYNSNKNKFNCCRISFSGGKDSLVLLDIVKNSIPHSNLFVVFGDTTMEFPDTYEVVEKIKKQCREDQIVFSRAAFQMSALQTWEIFGPPSRILRWCCSVHKAIPLSLKMKELMAGKEFNELVLVGVRSAESESRKSYPFVIHNKKIKGQVTYNAILDWNSAEIWLYTYWKRLIINRAYKLGNQRVGCLYCPMSLKTDYIKNIVYKEQINSFINIVKKHYETEDLINGYWCSRANGAQLSINQSKIHEIFDQKNYIIILEAQNNILTTWLKTVQNVNFPYSMERDGDKYIFKIPNTYLHSHRVNIAHFKNVLYKAAYCIGCRLCEINCPNSCIDFSNGLSIYNCKQCQLCNQQDYGCILYNSRRIPSIKGINQMKEVIDFLGTHAPKTEWLTDFFNRQNDFLTDNKLGPDQLVRFKKFLKISNLIDTKGITDFGLFIKEHNWKSDLSLGLILIHLSYSNQFKWYIKNLILDKIYSRKECIHLLHLQGYKEIASKNVTSAFKRICALPFGEIIHFGTVKLQGKTISTLCRTKPIPPDPRVFLYGLYKFAEACDGFYELTLGRLMDFEVASAGVSPAEIFGLSRNETQQYLHGLAQNYQDFVLSFTTTHGLELLNLNPDKNSNDVLTLF